jgi:hypothetical protein
VIYLTQDGKTLTPSQEEMKTRVPTGPTPFDVLVEAAKRAGTLAKPLISRVEPTEGGGRDVNVAAARLLSGKIGDQPKQSLLMEAEPLRTSKKGQRVKHASARLMPLQVLMAKGWTPPAGVFLQRRRGWVLPWTRCGSCGVWTLRHTGVGWMTDARPYPRFPNHSITAGRTD